MKRIVSILIVALLISGCGGLGQYKISKVLKEFSIEKPTERLRIGERFTYKTEWLGLDVGIVTLSVEGVTERNGREVYHVLARAQTTPVLSKLYKVDDIISSYIDVEHLYPVMFEK